MANDLQNSEDGLFDALENDRGRDDGVGDGGGGGGNIPGGDIDLLANAAALAEELQHIRNQPLWGYPDGIFAQHTPEEDENVQGRGGGNGGNLFPRNDDATQQDGNVPTAQDTGDTPVYADANGGASAVGQATATTEERSGKASR